MKVYLDIESRSELNIKAVGSYRYREHPSTCPLCIGWAVEGCDDIYIWWVGTPIPEIWRRPDTTFVAHNIQFDRVFFDYHIFKTRIEQWDDTIVRCRYYGLPAALEDVSAFLFGTHKDPRGKELVEATDGRGVCSPQRKRGQDWYWNNDEKDLFDLGEYCKQDVRLLIALDRAVGPLPREEREAAQMFERLNDNGIPIDYDFATAAVAIVEREAARAVRGVTELTNGEITTTNQTARMQVYAKRFGVSMPNCKEDTVESLLRRNDLPANVRAVLTARSLTNSAQVKKYAKALERQCADGRIHGEIITFGAHTLRTSSRGVQTQNGKRGKEKKYMPYRAAAVRRDPAATGDWVDWNFFLSTAVRSMIRAPKGYSIVDYDYSGIECRYVDWLVGDLEGLELARQKVDRYKILASSIFHKPADSIDGTERATGKEARLSGQYGVGWSTYRTRLDKTWGVQISVDEAKLAISTFRRDHYLIERSWGQIMAAWRSACAGVPARAVYHNFEVVNGWMVVTAPNGRSLYYYRPEGGSNPSYEAPGRTMTKKAEVIDHETGLPKEIKQQVPLRKHVYGGYLLENISQFGTGMIARDDMVAIQKRFDAESVCAEWLFMAHDEGVALVRNDHIEQTKRIMSEEMTRPVWWCRDLPIDVEGWVGEFYKKG